MLFGTNCKGHACVYWKCACFVALIFFIHYSLKEDIPHAKPQQLNRYPQKTAKLVNNLRARLHETLRMSVAGFDSCILLDLPTHENKGDSALTVGELNALHDVNMTIKHYSPEHARKDSFERIKTQLNPERTIVLAHGGRNIGVWENMDKKRADST